MTFYCIEPEVPGSAGGGAIVDYTVNPPRVEKMHLHFDGWMGNDLVEWIRNYLITERTQARLVDLAPTGVELRPARVTTSSQFRELQPGRKLPKFLWLRVTGRAGLDDFGVSLEHGLVVSQRVLDALQEGNLNYANVVPYDGT